MTERRQQTMAEKLSAHSIHLRNINQIETAEAVGRRALAMEPRNPEVLGNLGNVLMMAGKFREAKDLTEQAMVINPSLDALAHNLGLIAMFSGQWDRALSYFTKVEDRFVDAAWDKACALLSLGRWDEGFRYAEVRRQKVNMPVYAVPEWDGKPFDGTLWITSEQGIGDMLQFSRYIPWARSQCKRVIFDCFPTLMSLFTDYPGVDQFRAHEIEGGMFEPEADFHTPLMTLPMFHNTTPDTVPKDPNWFQQAAAAFPGIVEGDVGLLKVGVAWAGNPKHLRDRFRTIDLETMLPLFTVAEAQFYSFQVGHRARDIDLIVATSLVSNLAPQLTTWIKTAAALIRMDLVITVDTAIAHLAGALGVPTWLLLPKVPDWRWLLNRTDCPWYPSMRLFRQDQAGDWDSVISRVRHQLKRHASERVSPEQAAE